MNLQCPHCKYVFKKTEYGFVQCGFINDKDYEISIECPRCEEIINLELKNLREWENNSSVDMTIDYTFDQIYNTEFRIKSQAPFRR
jgi:uncharacterized C2H2 Zn-finger protein